jgi:hypothetical protein
MSIDYYVFTKSGQRVTRDQLVPALMKYAINSEIYCDIDTSKTIESEITEHCTVLCWPNESISRAELIEVLQQQNCVERDKLFEDGLLGYCNISASAAQDFFENFDSDYFERSLDKINSQALAEAKCAEVVYEVSTSSGRSDRSSFLQTAVCKAIAELSMGVIEDPQEGQFFWPSEWG